MQKFWYHSPVRFYKNKEDLLDMTNPQNTQYFGSRNPYLLELSVFHRFLIPNIDNEVFTTELELWIIGKKEIQIPCEFGISNGKLFRVTIISNESLSGELQIRNKLGEVLFYSNCVKFLDSTDIDGRKFIRIATKHLYNRNLFAYKESSHDWVITNIPAYCLGQFNVESDIENSRSGGNNTLLISESFIDEIVSYQFLSNGDSNILSFIQTHITNNHFYIDGTQRTAVEKIEAEEAAMDGIMKFANVKDGNGLNITFNENEIFKDVMKFVLSGEEKTLVYVDNEENLIQV